MSSVASQPIVSPERVRSEGAQPRSQINVVLFSGGSGTHSITEALIRHKQIALHILINAYDDGRSTGRLRRFVPIDAWSVGCPQEHQPSDAIG